MRVPPESGVGLASAAAVGLLVLIVGCEAVPTLTFEGAGDDAASSEAGGMCPAARPLNATSCCGSKSTVPCFGLYCSGANCTTGCDKCAPPDVCCSRSATNVVCLAVCR